jgi:tetratricopeptide (TPR) repeat protein
MNMQHPTVEALEALLLSKPRPQAASDTQVIRHLLAACPVCTERLYSSGWTDRRVDRLLTLPRAEADEPSAAAQGYDYDQAFTNAETATAEFLAAERPAEQPGGRTVDALVAELGFLPAEEQTRRVAEPRFAHLRLVHRLIERSHEARHRDASAMLHFANLARLAADACSAGAEGSRRRLADLRALAWGQYGNALRVHARLADAESALAQAESWRAQGTGDPLVRARLLNYLVTARITERRIESAIALVEEASQIYRDLGETHELAITMVQRGNALTHIGELEQAMRLFSRAIPLIDQERDPHLLLTALHNLVYCYIDLDRPEEALTLQAENRELYAEVGDDLILLRATWQEGELLRALGRLSNAEAALLRARQGFLDRELPFEAALLSLDLAAVYLKMGRTQETRRTVEEAVPIFRSIGVGRETIAALLQLQAVADREQQALSLIRLISAQLGRMPGRFGAK